MTDNFNFNNIFGDNNKNDKNNLDIIDKKRQEKNIKSESPNNKSKNSKNNINGTSDTANKDTGNGNNIGSKVLTGIMILTTVIFSLLFIILITSNLSFLITCGRVLTTIGKDGKKRTFNDIWFPSYYFYQENTESYPFCDGLKMDDKGYLKGRKAFFSGKTFSTGLPIEKYKFDFLSWFTRMEMSAASGIGKTFFNIVTDFFNYFNAVGAKTTIINNARVQDLLQIIEYIIPNNPYYRNLILFLIGVPLMFGIIFLSGVSSAFVYLYNLLTTNFPYNLIYLLGLSGLLLIICNFFFPFIFFIPLEVIFFPVTGIIYASLLPLAFVFLIILLSSANSLFYNIKTMLKLMFLGYFVGGYKAISKNAQENRNIYMFFVGLILLGTLISLFV